jgi:hypothetical protein
VFASLLCMALAAFEFHMPAEKIAAAAAHGRLWRSPYWLDLARGRLRLRTYRRIRAL